MERRSAVACAPAGECMLAAATPTQRGWPVAQRVITGRVTVVHAAIGRWSRPAMNVLFTMADPLGRDHLGCAGLETDR
jgi:hypothetical protein